MSVFGDMKCKLNILIEKNERFALISTDKSRPFYSGLVKTIISPYVLPVTVEIKQSCSNSCNVLRNITRRGKIVCTTKLLNACCERIEKLNLISPKQVEMEVAHSTDLDSNDSEEGKGILHTVEMQVAGSTNSEDGKVVKEEVTVLEMKTSKRNFRSLLRPLGRDLFFIFFIFFFNKSNLY